MLLLELPRKQGNHPAQGLTGSADLAATRPRPCGARAASGHGELAGEPGRAPWAVAALRVDRPQPEL